MIHKMKLHNGPYELIKQGIKTIELRLYDEKRQKIKAGDTLLFINTKTQKWLAVKVKGLHRADSFRELFDRIGDQTAMGFSNEPESAEAMALEMRTYYSEDAEKKYGVLGIEIEPPEVEMDFPVQCAEETLKYVIVAAFCDGKLVFCKQKERETLELPGGHIEPGETALDAAKRELYEETGITDIKDIFPIASYRAQSTTDVTRGAYGMLYVAEVGTIPPKLPDFEMEETRLFDISPYKTGWNWVLPELPEPLTHFEIYAVILWFLQRMILNDDIAFSEEPIDYYHRLKYYEEEVCVDYEHFDADSYLHYVMMRPDCEDDWSPLEKITPTEENYRQIRDELILSCKLFEFFTLLVDKFGAEKVKQDAKLMEEVRRSFSEEMISLALGEPLFSDEAD